MVKQEEQELTWKEFKDVVVSEAADSDSKWLYRGQASKLWSLDTSLGRHLSNRKTILAKEYHTILANVCSDENFRDSKDSDELSLPKQSPFAVGLLCGDHEHKRQLTDFFKVMIYLRHLGFPSPLLDVSEDPYIAAFFAVSSFASEKMVIWRFKFEKKFKPFGLCLQSSAFYFDSPTISGERHNQQKAQYLLAIEHQHEDTLKPKDKREGPKFHLQSLEKLNYAIPVQIEKIIISGSEGNGRLKILEELYGNEYNLSYMKIYGDTHIFENTVLKDQANKLLFKG